MSIVNLKYRKFNAILETGFFTKEGWDETFEIYFEYGSVILKLPPQHYKNVSASFVIKNRKTKKNFHFKSKKTWSFLKQSNDFVNDIIKKNIRINKASEGLKDIKLVEEIWKNYLQK